MIRIFEVLVAFAIVVALTIVLTLVLPSHGHVERTVEVASPVRQVYDSVNTFRRFPQWSAMRNHDPKVQMSLSGPEAGKGAKISWTSAVKSVGDGSLTITSSESDDKVMMTLDNDWIGSNKTYTVQLEPAANGKTLKINWAYDVDYGWNLIDRFGGLYINGDPAQMIQLNLNNLAALLAGFPNVDYKEQQIDVVDVAAKPVFLVETKSRRSLDEVADATQTAMTEIEEAMKKAGVTQAGPRMTITTVWGDEDYTFSVAVPVSASSITLNGQQYALTTPVAAPPAADEGDEPATPTAPAAANPGDRDKHGMLIVDANVRAALWYQGKALASEYTGSPAALPLLRVNQKAYAETHGYRYNDTGIGRPWDELTSAPDAAADEQTFKVYLPISL